MVILSDFDLQLIGEGTHERLYEKLGAHVLDLNGSSGTHFHLWAPHARERSGAHERLYEKLGADVLDLSGSSGTHFAVWAPNAREVSVVGDFNRWNPAV